MTLRFQRAAVAYAVPVMLAAGLVSGGVDLARADIVVDQVQDAAGGTVGPSIPWYQTFRQTHDNIVSVDLNARADTGGTVGVELLDEPCGNVLAYGEADVIGVGWFNVAFEDGPISLVPGEPYALRFVPVAGDIQWWRASPNDAYPNGALHSGWWDQVCSEPYDEGQWDYMFRTYADDAAVPTSEASWSEVKALYR